MALLKPFAHQKKSLAHAKKTPVVFDCSSPGTGKTSVAIWDFESRRKKKGGCALILAPRSLLRSAWQNDFHKFAPTLRAVVADASNREEAFGLDADAYITNVDAATWLAEKPKKFFAKFDTLIIDESSAYKHHSSQRSRAMAKIARYFEYRRALTGTPNGRSITDVWHQVYLLDDGKRLGTSFYAFRNTVCTPTQKGRNQSAIEWSDKDGAEEAVFSLISDIVVRHKFENCVDIPANYRYALEYELPAKHRKMYEQMETTAILEMRKSKKVITAVNAAVVAGKLLQIASGAVYDDTGEFALVDEGRYKLVLDLVEERPHSLVFFHWRHQRDALVAEAEKRGLTFCVIDGDAKDSERSEYVEAYQRGEYRVMFAHPRSAAHGLTLTKGTTTIWASPTYDLELYEQGSKRQHRMGQTQKTETITIVAPGTIDQRAYDVMMTKGVRMQNLLDLFES